VSGVLIGNPLRGHPDAVDRLHFLLMALALSQVLKARQSESRMPCLVHQSESPCKGILTGWRECIFSQWHSHSLRLHADSSNLGYPCQVHQSASPCNYSTAVLRQFRFLPIVLASLRAVLTIQSSSWILYRARQSAGLYESILVGCISPDGTRIVSSSEDETLRIWDAVSKHVNRRAYTWPISRRQFSCVFSRWCLHCLRLSDTTVRIWGVVFNAPTVNPYKDTLNASGRLHFRRTTTLVLSHTDNTDRICDACQGGLLVSLCC
jgi:WD40 repeat protein